MAVTGTKRKKLGMGGRKVPSPTGKPSPKREAIKKLDRGDMSATKGGSKKSAYTAPPKVKKMPAKPGVSAFGAAKKIRDRKYQIEDALNPKKKRKQY